MNQKLIAPIAAGVLLLLQSCTKNQTSTQTVSQTKHFGSKTLGSTVAYEDPASTAFFQRTSGAEAFDGAFSCQLSNGTVYWFNNDSFVNQLSGGVLPCIFNNHNSTLLQPASHSWNPALTSTLTYAYTNYTLFQPLNSSHWYWPCAALQINGSPFVYLNEIETASGGLGFSVVASTLAAVNTSTNAVTYYGVPNLNGIDFGVGMVQGIDGYVYTYGYKQQGAPSVAANIYVARFLPSSVSTTWQFWNGSTWGSTSTSAAVIGVAPSNGVYISFVNSKYVMITTGFNLQCNQGTAIYGCTSTSVTGPFTSQQVIYNITDKLNGNTPFYYTPVIHPEFNANSQFLFTYCINGYAPCVAACNNNQFLPDTYRPRGVLVPYSVLGL
jgi:hypothetical protein